MNINNFILILFLAFFSTSCSKYQKVLKSDDFDYKYQKALEYYHEGDYNRALPLFNELSTVMMGTLNIEKISYYFAYCHYSTGDNLMAAYLFDNYTKSFPNGKHHEECSYMRAFCYYLESPNYSLDPTNNYKAINELQEFIDKYPESSKIDTCNILIDQLTDKLSKKAFENAKQYFITENYKAAIKALDNVIIDFPSLRNREEAHFLIIKSNYLLAINSISDKMEERLMQTINIYEQFKDNYKKSKYLEELEVIYNDTKGQLDKLKI